MPAITSRLCETCNHPERSEIDRRLLNGDSARSVSEWTRSVGGYLSHVAINKHKKNHLDVMSQVKQQLQTGSKRFEPKDAFDEKVEEAIDSIQTLDDIQRYGRRIAKAVADKYEKQNLVSVSEAMIFGHATKAAIGAAKTKHELLHGKKIDATVTTTNEDVRTMSDEQLQKIIAEGE